jgi:uncharacterized membrane protein
MNQIIFKNNSSRRIYDDYMTRVEKCIGSLSATDRSELLMELNSHIYEGTAGCTDSNEVEVLLDVTGKLGAPEEFLKPLVAGKKLDQAVRSFNPKDVFQAIKLNLRYGFSFFIFGLLYLFLFSFVIIALLKVIAPRHTGLFYSGSSFVGFGYVTEIGGLTEKLGYWIIPMALFSALLFYVFITLILKVLRK